MPVEIVGQQLRIHVRTPKGATGFATHDVGRIGRLQRVSAYYPGYGWKTQSWRLNLSDYNSPDYVISSINSLRGVSPYTKSKAIYLAKQWFKRKR